MENSIYGFKCRLFISSVFILTFIIIIGIPLYTIPKYQLYVKKQNEFNNRWQLVQEIIHSKNLTNSKIDDDYINTIIKGVNISSEEISYNTSNLDLMYNINSAKKVVQLASKYDEVIEELKGIEVSCE